MQRRVTAILVAHGGGPYIERTLASLARQTRKPDLLVVIDTAPTDASTRQLAQAAPALHLSSKPGATFGSAVAEAVRQLRGPDHLGTNAGVGSGATQGASPSTEWLWLLGEDNTADPRALEQLLSAVEIAPSVVVAGPKLLSVDDPSMLVSLGETMSTLGTSVRLVENELDQAQYDTRDDVLGVAAAGMLVRRDVWTTLGGFDPG
ncbi:MAG TPA: glycosyltransferase, partial [Terrimesophilobacter sp.]|nr:glycosyltransferase [Terrimesophilobacter sp.]